jgi:hypothetical protein
MSLARRTSFVDDAPMEEGVVLELWRWPVAGMAGERLPSVRVDGHGVGGDRIHAVLGRDGAPLSVPRWSAAYPFNMGATVDPASPPHALVTSPDGRTFRWGDPRLRTALEDDLGVTVELRRDLAGSGGVLLADARAVAGLEAHVRLDLALDGLAPGTEIAFAGGVRVRLLEDAGDGGAHARAVVDGRIAAGEPAWVVRT